MHTNGDLYLDSNALLTITTNPPSVPLVRLTAANSIHRGRKDSTTCNGTVQVMSSAPTPSLLTLQCSANATSAVVPTPTLGAWKGGMQCGVGTLAARTSGIVGQIGMYWHYADLRIALQLNGQGPHSIVVLNEDFTPNTALTGTLMTFINDPAFNANKSDFKGTKPVFFSDVPLQTPGPGCSCNLNVYPPTGCPAIQQNCYWGTPLRTFTPTFTPTPTRNLTTTRTPTKTATSTFTPGTPTPTFGNDHSFYNLDRTYTTNTSLTLPTPGSPTPAAQAIGRSSTRCGTSCGRAR
jgi:hypothetical protein